MKKIVILIFSIFLSLMMTGCLREREYLTIYGENEVNINTTILLTHNYKGQRDVIWTSLNPNVASIDEEGYVKTHQSGTTTITLRVGNSLAQFNLVVKVPNLTISGDVSGRVSYTSKYSIKCVDNKDKIDLDDATIIWKVSDERIATVNEYGTVTYKSEGTFVLTAEIFGVKLQKGITVLPLRTPTLSLNGPRTIYVGETANIVVGVTNPDTISLGTIVIEVSDKTILSMTGSSTMREIKGLKAGTTEIRVSCTKLPEVYKVVEITVLDTKILSLTGRSDMVEGEFNQLKLNLNSINPDEVIFTSSDVTKAIVDENGLVLALSSGTVTITATYKFDSNIKDTFIINIASCEKEPIDNDELKRVNEIIESMTLSQKVGQMFAVGFSGTSFSSALETAINDYNFGNVIYMGANVTNPNTLAKLSNDIQNAMIKANGVPAFITIDQEGGKVCRLKNGGTHFISNMAMGAIEDYTKVYFEGLSVGEELRNYGINVNFAPVLDVNNNYDNPVIGTRSYGDNPFLVAKYGVQMFKGLALNNVMGTAKHFPGHGNTNNDSHYGLPTITSSKEELYATEFAPFITAINNGIDAIMTSHIVFTAIDDTLPATLSEKVLTDLLRNEFGYDGLIITDGMEMGALKGFGDTASLGVQAVKAGADILLYTDNVNPRSAHQAIMNAIANGEISEERINDSVRRILLKKIKYDVLDGYYAEGLDISNMLEEHEDLNNEFACLSLTQMFGENPIYNKEDSILIISPECSNDLGNSEGDNSLGNYVSNYLNSNGYECDYYTISNNVTSAQSSQIMQMISDYDHVIIACSNVYASKYTNTKTLVNNITKKMPNTLVIALDSPYDYLSYDNLNNYVSVYCYQKGTVVAISKYLNGEFKAVGVSPFDFD